MRDDYLKKIGVIRPKPTDSSGQPFEPKPMGKKKFFYSSGQPFEPKPMGKKAGGRIGFSKGTGRSGVPAMDIKSKISLAKKKKKNKKSDFGMLSVKAGIDKNPNPTHADRIAAGKMKNKKKVTV